MSVHRECLYPLQPYENAAANCCATCHHSTACSQLVTETSVDAVDQLSLWGIRTGADDIG